MAPKAKATALTHYSPAAGLGQANAQLGKKPRTSGSLAKPSLYDMWILSTVNADNVVETDLSTKGQTIVVNAPMGPEGDRKKHTLEVQALLAGDYLCLNKNAYAPLFK